MCASAWVRCGWSSAAGWICGGRSSAHEQAKQRPGLARQCGWRGAWGRVPVGIHGRESPCLVVGCCVLREKFLTQHAAGISTGSIPSRAGRSRPWGCAGPGHRLPSWSLTLYQTSPCFSRRWACLPSTMSQVGCENVGKGAALIGSAQPLFVWAGYAGSEPVSDSGSWSAGDGVGGGVGLMRRSSP